MASSNNKNQKYILTIIYHFSIAMTASLKKFLPLIHEFGLAKTLKLFLIIRMYVGWSKLD